MDPIRAAQRKREARILRVTRKIHRTTGIVLFAFFCVVSCSGLLLGWKKHSGGVILPKAHQGQSTNPQDWLPIHVLHEKAIAAVREHISPDLSLDPTTGALLHVERRRSDFIENIHDGSALDRAAALPRARPASRA